MSALPVPPAARPLPMTAAEYAALPEEEGVRYELQEGMIVMAARPIPRHQDCLAELYVQLRSQAPPHLKVLLEVDIDLQLAPAHHPGTVRVPDLVVVTRESYDRVGHEGGLLRAAEVVLAVEVFSTGSRRTDSVIKYSEYADAGIGHYWMVDLLGGPALTACHLAGEFGYADVAPATGVITLDTPFAARLDLDLDRLR